MAIQMIFAFLRIKLDRAMKSISGFYGAFDGRIIQFAIQQIGFTAKLGRGVGVRIGHQRIAIQHGKFPVHQRIGRKSGLHRVNMRRHIRKAFFDCVKI